MRARVPLPNRFTLTVLKSNGDRVLARGYKFQYHRDTRPEADELLANIVKRHTPEALAEIYGPRADSLEVREIACYLGGGAVHSDGFDNRRLGDDVLTSSPTENSSAS